VLLILGSSLTKESYAYRTTTIAQALDRRGHDCLDGIDREVIQRTTQLERIHAPHQLNQPDVTPFLKTQKPNLQKRLFIVHKYFEL
jgi:hypothetical protein